MKFEFVKCDIHSIWVTMRFRLQASPNNMNMSLTILDNIDAGTDRQTEKNMVLLIFGKMRIVLSMNKSMK